MSNHKQEAVARRSTGPRWLLLLKWTLAPGGIVAGLIAITIILLKECPHQKVISGTVVDTSEHTALEDVIVVLMTEGAQDFTDSNGFFKIVVPGDHDTVSVSFSRDGYKTWTQHVEVPTEGMHVSLSKRPVVDAGGAPPTVIDAGGIYEAGGAPAKDAGQGGLVTIPVVPPVMPPDWVVVPPAGLSGTAGGALGEPGATLDLGSQILASAKGLRARVSCDIGFAIQASTLGWTNSPYDFKAFVTLDGTPIGQTSLVDRNTVARGPSLSGSVSCDNTEVAIPDSGLLKLSFRVSGNWTARPPSVAPNQPDIVRVTSVVARVRFVRAPSHG